MWKLLRLPIAVAIALMAGAGLGRWSAPAAEVAPATSAPLALQAAAPAAVCAPAQAAAPVEPAQAPARAAPDERSAAMSEALDKLARTSDPQLKTPLIREIAALKTQDDLRSTWSWLTQHRDDPGYAENIRNLLYHWSYAKPEDVAALLPDLNSGEAQTAAAQQLAQLWHKKDPHAYRAWVASLPDGALKSAAGSPY